MNRRMLTVVMQVDKDWVFVISTHVCIEEKTVFSDRKRRTFLRFCIRLIDYHPSIKTLNPTERKGLKAGERILIILFFSSYFFDASGFCISTILLCYSSATHRTFGINQWQELRSRLEEWRHSLQSVRTSMQTVVPTVDV